MKRGLIMEVSKRKAVVLMKDGSFERVRLKKGERPVRGQEYICPTETAHEPFRRKQLLLPSFSLSLVAVIIFVLVASGLPFGQNKASAAAYVSFDINPSIEVAVDKEMNVIKVRALNEEAKSLLEGSSSSKDSSLLIFTDSLFKTLKEYGYFDTYDDLLITSTIEGDSVSPEVRKRLVESIEELKSNEHINNTDVVVSVMETSTDTRKLANENGLSMGKFLVYQDALKEDNSLTIQQISGLSYSELRKLLASDETPKQDAEQTLPLGAPSETPQHVNQEKSDLPDEGIVNKTDDQKDAVVDTDKSENAAADEAITGEDAKNTLTTTPTGEEKESKKANTAPAKDEQDKKDDKYKNESKRDTNKSYSKKNSKNDLQVNIVLQLRGSNGDDLPPGQLKLLERLQIDFSQKDKHHKKHHKEKHSHHRN